MHTDKLFLLGLASVIINFIGYYPYIKSILKNGVKPQRVTWGLWSVLITIAFINQIQNGGGYSSYFIGSTLVLVLTVFILSFKRGVGGGSKLDIASLTAATLLFVVWAITKDTRTTTFVVVLIDATGIIPTIYKAYKQPETEAYLQWFTSAISAVFALVAVVGHDYILFIYPAYVIVGNSLIVLAKYLGTQKLQVPIVK
jgi:hypothetical protein